MADFKKITLGQALERLGVEVDKANRYFVKETNDLPYGYKDDENVKTEVLKK